jgi:hypothetical protein
MAHLECEITARREDGAFRWRRLGASEPSGWLPVEIVPSNVNVGSIVLIDFMNNGGHTSPASCRLRDSLEDENPIAKTSQELQEAPSPEPSSGLLFWVNVMNPLENESSEGKLRPAVLVSQRGDDWRVMGLTTKSTYATGEQRRPIPNAHSVGLSGPGFLWGHYLVRITADSVHSYIGKASYRLVEEIVDLARHDLTNDEIDDLRSVTRPDVQRSNATISVSNEDLSLSAESLIEYFNSHQDQILKDLTKYFCSTSFTGRHFEHYSRAANQFAFDGNDIAAVMCLSITPHANIAASLLSLNTKSEFRINAGEREIPIWQRPRSDYEEQSRFNLMFNDLCQVQNIASVIASKLMASKFPHSIPIRDGDVAALLNHPEKWWLGWHEAMQSSSLRKRLSFLRDSIGLQEVSLLRVADVALWMEAQRRKKDGTLGRTL